MSNVTERDFRKDEFKDANPDDYEFRGDGAVVRKDRWEMGIRKLQCALLPNVREFEIDDIVKEAKLLIKTQRDETKEEHY